MSYPDDSSAPLRQRVLNRFTASRPEVATSIWLVQLRWAAVIGQLLTITTAHYFFARELPLQPLLVLVGFTAATNIVYGVWLRGETVETMERGTGPSGELRLVVPPVAGMGYSRGTKLRVAGLLMAVDLITLTAMLHFSGGVDNPFSSFYFVNLAVAGVILRLRWAWSLTVLAIVGFGCLLFSYVPLSVLQAGTETSALTRHLGAFIAFSTSAAVVTYFVTTTSQEVNRRQEELRRVQAEQAKGQQLESLSTLAAGAAHELATPMSTVVLVARELQHHLEGVAIPDSVRNDLQLIDSELRHCRAIIDRMRSAAGDSAGEPWQQSTLGDLIDIVLEGIREPERVEITPAAEAIEDCLLWLPQEAVAQAIRNLIHNGLDASRKDRSVICDAGVDEDWLRLSITDAGEGMSAAVQDRVGEPFFTTKEPGKGMGLGLFLTRNVVKRLGGQLHFESVPGQGTTAVVSLPRRMQTGGKSLPQSETRK
ncbi:sensor histidine kinase [Planctomycetaceae bacterium SH139]